MTVVELIEHLCNCDPNAEVLVTGDEEGNDVRYLSYVADDQACKGSPIEIGFRELTDDLKDMGYSEEDILDGKPCVVLF